MNFLNLKIGIFRLLESLERLRWRLTPLAPWNAIVEPLLALCGAIMILGGCSTAKYVPIETKVETHYVDSTIWRVRDSVVIIPIERIVDVVSKYDTLVMETDLAKSTSYVDSTLGILRGELVNKHAVSLDSHIEYRDRIINQTDSVYVEKPVYIEKEKIVKRNPKLLWISLSLNLLFVLGAVLALYLKLKI